MKKIKRGKLGFVLFLGWLGIIGTTHATTHYVNQASTDPASPYTSWETAAQTIQAAVNVAESNDFVIVTNGTYYPATEISVGNSITIRSVNGAEMTIVDGGTSHRCFNLGSSACTIDGFTIQHGKAPDDKDGGGVYCANSTPNISSCTIVGNSARYGGGINRGTATLCLFKQNSSQYGGGLYYGTANNCLFIQNSTTYRGGGMRSGTANNCSFINNTAQDGGGIYQGTANNCIVWYNTASRDGNNLFQTTLQSTCSPDVTHGENGCITNAPLFVDLANNNAHLSIRSPCINAGDNSFATTATDLDGRVRIFNGTVDMGAYELKAHYVNSANLNPVSPYISWETAATTIQTAVDTAEQGDLVIVTNGIYYPSSEIQVHKAIAIQSVNGADVTLIDGGGNNRCLNLGDSASTVSGFTIQHGKAPDDRDGGGIYCANSISIIFDCTIVSNSAKHAGGIYNGTASHCLFIQNNATRSGGGTDQTKADHCSYIKNTTSGYGGGSYQGTANNCFFSQNNANQSGGGSYGTKADHCSFIENTALNDSGGGSYFGTANNCFFSQNSAKYGGGRYGSANNCTFIKNSAEYGGGMQGEANNCILWYNTASISGNNLAELTAHYSCSPDVTHGTDGCITNRPSFASISHLGADSPCIGAGSTNYLSGTDIDGEAWKNPPSMGCDEYSSETYGELSFSIAIPPEALQNVSTPVEALLQGAASLMTINFGDGTIVTNQMEVSHTWSSLGTYELIFSAYNNDYPQGFSVTQQIEIVHEYIYVSPDGNDAHSGTSWSTAKQTIQAGVDALEGHVKTTVLVANGTYYPTTEITVTNAIFIRSINGANLTFIDGSNSHRCFNLGSASCSIEGFTIQHGYNTEDGGGVFCENISPVVSRCIFRENNGDWGGGIMYGTANNCSFFDNNAAQGGGMCKGAANNCTFFKNHAGYGGGVSYGTIKNCILWYNTGTHGDDISSTTARFTCSRDMTHGSNGCITNKPLMTSITHLQAESPCIGAGSINDIPETDIDGEAWENPPSIGCDEFNTETHGELLSTISIPSKIKQNYTALVGYFVQGAASQTSINFDDGTIVTNQMRIQHAWSSAGTYNVIFSAYNNDYPQGLSTTQQVTVLDNDIYVSPNGNDLNSGISWLLAKQTIQAGVDAAIMGQTIWVTNGIYSLSSEIVVSNAVAIRSANGADLTIVDGGESNRCFNLGDSACTISGFTIQHGKAPDDGDGGGVYCGNSIPIIFDCTIVNNSAKYAGGICRGTANNCVFSENIAHYGGGGMYQGTANNCTFIKNSAMNGAGMNDGTAKKCSFVNNTAQERGGGMSYGTANNCTFFTNTAQNAEGGGMYYGTANNCTFAKNSATYGGGICEGTANNCIAYYNTASNEGNNLYQTTAHYSCSPDLVNGTDGCIDRAPFLKDVENGNLRLLTSSPCVDAGSNSYVSVSTDLDGQPRIQNTIVDMGAYESYASTTRYVNPANSNPVPPYTSWATAATNIQDAVNTTQPTDIVIATNGTYFLASEILITNAITLQSVNGADVTLIDGKNNHRCLNLGSSDCSIIGFTIQHGVTADDGGGIYCENDSPIILNCIIKENTAQEFGGGMTDGTAHNCIFSDNFAEYGGGKSFGVANNCTFFENFADLGGGMVGGAANNCILWYNTATSEGDDFYFVGIHHSCSPKVTHGESGCITNAPIFINRSNGNLHLALFSPCINAGDNGYVTIINDLDGLPRIQNHAVDMGVYETNPITDSDGDGLPDEWERIYFNSPTTALPFENPDADNQNNLEEYIAGTDPTDPLSFFYISEVISGTNGSILTWHPSIADRTYTVLWTTSLTNEFQTLQSELLYPIQSYTDTIHGEEESGFYKVNVKPQ